MCAKCKKDLINQIQRILIILRLELLTYSDFKMLIHLSIFNEINNTQLLFLRCRNIYFIKTARETTNLAH